MHTLGPGWQIMEPIFSFCQNSIGPGTRKLKKQISTRSNLTPPFKPPAKKKLILKISLIQVDHKPNGSIICQPGHKVWMTFEIFILKKELLPLMFVLFSSQTIFSLIINPPYSRISLVASACISYSKKLSFFLDYSISYCFCLVSVCSIVLCFFKKS